MGAYSTTLGSNPQEMLTDPVKSKKNCLQLNMGIFIVGTRTN